MKKPLLDRVLMAYRPMYLHGLLLDGQYQRPAAAGQKDASEGHARRRLTLVALAGLHQAMSSLRSRK